MKWKNAVKDVLPPTSVSVLISLNGVYHIAVFDGEKLVFRIKNESEILEISAANSQLYWTELENTI